MKQTNRHKSKLENYQITITRLSANQTRITEKPVKLFHKCININVIHMSVLRNTYDHKNETSTRMI